MSQKQQVQIFIAFLKRLINMMETNGEFFTLNRSNYEDSLLQRPHVGLVSYAFLYVSTASMAKKYNS